MKMHRIECGPAYEITADDVARHVGRVMVKLVENADGPFFVAELPADMATMDEVNLWSTETAHDETEAALNDRVKAFRITKWQVRNAGEVSDDDLFATTPSGLIALPDAEATFRTRLLAHLLYTLAREGWLRIIIDGSTREEGNIGLIAA